MATLSTIKNWFKTGLKPTQAQFSATWDSFWHKDQSIPQASIEGLPDALDGKVNNGALHGVAFTGDYNDLDNKPNIGSVPAGDVLIFKRNGNEGAGIEENDLVIGFVEDSFIKGVYNATGSDTLVSSYNIIEKIDF